MDAISFVNAAKRFRSGRKITTALDDLSFAVPAGSIFGFLGPNGAGKTTAIRCLLGLVMLDRGHATLLGRRVPEGLPKVISKVGCMVDTPPAFIPHLSVVMNLKLIAELAGVGQRRVNDVVDRVGLTSHANKRIKQLSLGMRQRVGVAASLLKDPDLLVLDEPANGLDPAGVREINDQLRGFADQGRTIFVSSHRLAEIEQLCDFVAIIANGQLRAFGSIADVVGSRPSGTYLVRVGANERVVAQSALSGAGFSIVDGSDDTFFVSGVDVSSASNVMRVLASTQVYPSEFRPHGSDLETVFLALTSESE